MEDYVGEFTPRVEEIVFIRELMQQKVVEVVQYFGEDLAKCDIASIFRVLQEFQSALRASTDALGRQEKSKARVLRSQSKSPGLDHTPDDKRRCSLP
jgi:hypothetical protein